MTSNDQQSTPLNAEEETSLRLSFEQGRITGEPPYYFEIVRRLLATLDAARKRPSALDEAAEEVRRAKEAVAASLPVILAVRAWRDTPRTKFRVGARLEQDILDAIGDFDEYARLTEPDAGEVTDPRGEAVTVPDGTYWSAVATPDTTEATPGAEAPMTPEQIAAPLTRAEIETLRRLLEAGMAATITPDVILGVIAHIDTLTAAVDVEALHVAMADLAIYDNHDTEPMCAALFARLTEPDAGDWPSSMTREPA